VQQLPQLTRHPLGSWNIQHIRCRQQFSMTKKMLHWYKMLFPGKISADKDAKRTNGDEQSKKGSWSTTIKLPTDEIELLPKTPAKRTTTIT
jgi:hypothetical protein